MGKLIDRERRARAKGAKEDRTRRIREEAIRAFTRLPYVEVTLDGIGQTAGVKRGVASMYFGSKEELFLELLRDQLEQWYGELEAGLDGQPRLEDGRLARLVAGSLARRTTLTRLLSLAAVVLEQTREIIEAYRFQRWQRDRMVAVGEELERHSTSLGPGEGVRLLHLVQLAAGAFHPIANPKGSLAVNLQDPDFEPLRLSLEHELEAMVRRLLG